jgi:hypothetical protein
MEKYRGGAGLIKRKDPHFRIIGNLPVAATLYINFEQLRHLSPDTLDNRRNCRHNHMLDELVRQGRERYGSGEFDHHFSIVSFGPFRRARIQYLPRRRYTTFLDVLDAAFEPPLPV